MVFSSVQLIFVIGAVLALLIALVFIVMPFISRRSSTCSNNKKLSTKWIVAAIIVGVLSSSILLYKRYGALESLEDKQYIEHITKALSKIQANQNSTPAGVLNQLLALEQQLPKRSALWSHLAGVYQHMGFTQNAAAAYQKAAQWSPHIASYTIQEAYFVSSLEEGALDSNLKTRLILFLTQDPLNQDILNLLAIDAYQRQDYNLAIQYWHTILHKSKEVSLEDRQAISVMLASAQHHLQKN